MRSIFPLRQRKRNLILQFSWYKTLGKRHRSTCEFHLYYWDQVFKVNEWCLMNCFHHESRVSNQIVTLLLPREMQTFSACGSLSFTIQNIYVNSNPVFLNLFNFQERKTRYWNEIRRSWLEIYLETKHTKSRARINTRAIALSRFLFKFLFEI